MDNDAVFQYVSLFLNYVSVWALITIAVLVWAIRNADRLPGLLETLSKHVSSAKIGALEVELRQVKQSLRETEETVKEIEEENQRLSQLYRHFDPHAPVAELEQTRQELKAIASSVKDMPTVLQGLAKGASPADAYAAAEILRTRRDPAQFDALITSLERIASDPELEGLRYHTVWTLASAAHRTLISAIKHHDRPRLSTAQLEHAERVMRTVHDHPHVALDRPDNPKMGIRGPAGYALNWISTGLEKHESKPD